MGKQKYIGIENELITFENNEQIFFRSTDFDKLKTKYYQHSDTSIRTDTGNGYYIDGSEIEILTPPIPINKGFASRVTDSLIVGRNHIITNSPELQHTGYSMHWNLTADGDSDQFYENIAIPFQLFGLTPLSVGVNLRLKGNNRFELLGDSLTNEDQIRATALLLGAYSLASKNHYFPIIVKEFSKVSTNNYTPNLLPDGRYTMLTLENILTTSRTINQRSSKIKKIQAQTYLELFYEWLSPYIKKVGEKSEIEQLEGFISGTKKLEMDDFKYYSIIKQSKDKKTYTPSEVNTINGSRSQVLTKTRDVNPPIEGILLGKYATNENFECKSLTWNRAVVKEDDTGYVITGIDTIYKFAKDEWNHKNKDNKIKYNGSINTSKMQPKRLINILTKLNQKISYNIAKDNSALNTKGTIKDYFSGFNKKFLKNLINIQAASVVGSLVAATLITEIDSSNHVVEKKQADILIKQYEEKTIRPQNIELSKNYYWDTKSYIDNIILINTNNNILNKANNNISPLKEAKQ